MFEATDDKVEKIINNTFCQKHVLLEKAIKNGIFSYFNLINTNFLVNNHNEFLSSKGLFFVFQVDSNVILFGKSNIFDLTIFEIALKNLGILRIFRY